MLSTEEILGPKGPGSEVREVPDRWGIGGGRSTGRGGRSRYDSRLLDGITLKQESVVHVVLELGRNFIQCPQTHCLC